MKAHNVITLDYYTEDTGYYHEVMLVTDDFDRARHAFDDEKANLRAQDIDNRWDIEADYEDFYFSYHKMPEYCRLKLTTTILD